MDCSCIKDEGGKFAFKLESIDCQTLAFTDLSNWNEEDNYIVPDSYTITITKPNGVDVDVSINPKKTTILKGSDLKTSICIPDGIYCFKIASCGVTYSRTKAITCIADCQLTEAIAKAASGELNLDLVIELNNYLHATIAAANNGQSEKAAGFYKILKKELNKLNCDCSCQ